MPPTMASSSHHAHFPPLVSKVNSHSGQGQVQWLIPGRDQTSHDSQSTFSSTAPHEPAGRTEMETKLQANRLMQRTQPTVGYSVSFQKEHLDLAQALRLLSQGLRPKSPADKKQQPGLL